MDTIQLRNRRPYALDLSGVQDIRKRPVVLAPKDAVGDSRECDHSVMKHPQVARAYKANWITATPSTPAEKATEEATPAEEATPEVTVEAEPEVEPEVATPNPEVIEATPGDPFTEETSASEHSAPRRAKRR